MHDRRWMVIDESTGRMQSQRQIPRLALIRALLGPDADEDAPPDPDAGFNGITLFDGSPEADTEPLSVPLVHADDEGARTVKIELWGTGFENAVDQGDEAAAWVCKFLGKEGLRLVHQGDECVRNVPPNFPLEESADAVGSKISNRVSLADGFPLLLTSKASLRAINSDIAEDGGEELPMDRFRPNIVVVGNRAFAEDWWRRVRIGSVRLHGTKRCTRCIQTTTNQETAEQAGFYGQPLKTLRRTREEPLSKNTVCFGMNMSHAWPPPQGEELTLRVGDSVVVEELGWAPAE